MIGLWETNLNIGYTDSEIVFLVSILQINKCNILLSLKFYGMNKRGLFYFQMVCHTNTDMVIFYKKLINTTQKGV